MTNEIRTVRQGVDILDKRILNTCTWNWYLDAYIEQDLTSFWQGSVLTTTADTGYFYIQDTRY